MTVTDSEQESSARTEHEVRLTGLEPDTLYYYSVGTPTSTLAGGDSYQFRTSPESDPASVRPVRVWVIGDSGTADANARAVRDAYTTFTGSRPTDVWLMLGDNAYNDGFDSEYQRAVFDTYPAMLRKTVLWPAYGNHDGYSADAATNTGPYYNIFTLPKQAEAGGVPSGTEAYYSFNYANIHFVCLESFETDRSPAGAMLKWLQNDLAANTQPWVFVYFHHPPYSKGSHDSDAEIELKQMRANALPILENFGVDLVMAGHSHAYERSFLIDGHYGDSTTFNAFMKKDGRSGRPDVDDAYRKPAFSMAPREGAVYMVAGTSGKISGGTLNHPAMFTSQNVLGSVVLDVTGNRLDATFLDSTGIRRDYFSIVKGEGGPPPPPPPPTAEPFGGTRRAIPGAIEAEHFDTGGQNIAYYDTTTGNRGGATRTAEDVDIESTADAGGGYDIGWTRPGEWLQYSVDVAADGNYDLRLRLAAAASGGELHLEQDGVPVTAPIRIESTGGFQVWRTVTVSSVPLKAGARRLRLVFDKAGATGGIANLNRFEFTTRTGPRPYRDTPAVVPGKIEAENFDEGGPRVAYFDTTTGNRGAAYRTSDDVDIQPTVDSGADFNVGWMQPGEWLHYTVNVETAGTYAVALRVASGTGGGPLSVEGGGGTVTVNVPNTAGWQQWRTVPAGNLQLPAGLQSIILRSGGTASNVNFLNLTRLP